MPRLLVPLTLASSVFLSACTVVYVQPEDRTPAPQDEVDQPEPEQQPPPAAAPAQPDDPERRQPIEPRRRPAPQEPVRPALPPDRPEPQPPVEPAPEPDRPIVPQEPVEPGDPRTVWVCHGETDSRWLRVPDRAAEAHSRHGDPVSTEPQAAGAQCERPSAEPPERREAPEPRQPERPAEPQTAWVCHGAASARWMQVPAPAAEAHRQHGDPVSTEPQPVGSPCARGDRPNTQPAVQPERPPAPERPQRPQMQTPRQPGNPQQPQQPEPPAEQSEPPAEQPEPPAEQPRQPEPSPFAWVCHGEQNPTWQRVAVAAADAHRGHGDAVSTEAREVGAPCQRDEAPAPQEPAPPPQEPGPPPQEPRQQRRPGEPGPTREPRGAQFVWVCHGDENPAWLRVAASAADAHREHGDTVSADAQEAGTACERGQGEPPPQEPEQPPSPEPGQPQQPEPPPEQPQEPQYVWVCHGARNAAWQRVTVAAADAHRRHGDPVSTESREVGAACERGP